MRSVRSTLPVSSLLAGLLTLLAAGCDGPTAPHEEAFAPPEPAFLIGNSPLITLVKLASGERAIEYEVDANRGIVEASDSDRFLIRTDIAFTNSGGLVADLGACIQKPNPVKQGELVRGGNVALNGCIQIPAADWDAILLATPVGETIDVHVTIELLLVDAAGKVHVLDGVSVTEAVDPQSAV